MLDCVQLIARYMSGLTEQEFRKQTLTQDAVMHRIEILGEAASQLPAGFAGQYPEVPWRSIIDMRNRLIHGYFTVRLDLVWQVATSDVPALEPQLRRIRSTL